MTAILRIILFPFFLLLPLVSYCQAEAEWLVEMNTTNGSFEAVGPSLTGIYTLYVNLQCKDETNGQYIFIPAEFPISLHSVDINNAQVIDVTPYPLGTPEGLWGFYCYQNCDSLLLILRNPSTNNSYVSFFDRFDGTELIQFGDSIINTSSDPWNIPMIYNGFDPVHNMLYLYSEDTELLSVMNVSTGEIINTYPTSISPMFLIFDEINNKLYALENFDYDNYRLLVFNSELGDFTQIGNSFTSIGEGYHTPTIDGNNQRLFLTRNSTYSGSFLTAIDLLTGELLTDVQTMPGDPDNGPFGGPNTINGQYFNSTDQLITLHWGVGSKVTSTNVQLPPKLHPQIFPNPNQGEFKLDLSGYTGVNYDLKIVNLKGQIVYEKDNLVKGEKLDLDLASGYYIANVSTEQGIVLSRIPFLVELRE